MSNEQIEQIKKVFRVPLKNGGFQFTDQSCNILRKKATRPYTHMAIQFWTRNDNGQPHKFLTFHSKSNPSPNHSTYHIERIVEIEEPGIA